MKRSYKLLRSKPSVLSLFLIVLLLTDLMAGEEWTLSDDDTYFYDPRWFVEIPTAEACVPATDWPDSGCYSIPSASDYLSFVGYPMRWAIFKGLNDTLQFYISLFNQTEQNYSLSDKNCEEWYIPRLYLLGAVGPGATPLGESSKLGYRIRGWFGGFYKTEPHKELPPMRFGELGLVMDIWNLPEGRFQICLEPTDKVPSDFVAVPAGLTYEFYPPQSLADSLNAYAGCFWRIRRDHDFLAAKDRVDMMLALNPTSVPGWWFKMVNALDLQDSTTAREALAKAREFLEKMSDPALPDSTERPLMKGEKTYLDWMHTMFYRAARDLGI